MRGLVYSDMHTHRDYGKWVCAGACVHIRVKCLGKSVFVYLRVHMCMCTHTPTCKHLYDLFAALSMSGQTYYTRIINMCIVHLCCNLFRDKV